VCAASICERECILVLVVKGETVLTCVANIFCCICPGSPIVPFETFMEFPRFVQLNTKTEPKRLGHNISVTETCPLPIYCHRILLSYRACFNESVVNELWILNKVSKILISICGNVKFRFLKANDVLNLSRNGTEYCSCVIGRAPHKFNRAICCV
jgi:hypothetical protein